MHILYRLCSGLGTKPRPDWFTKEGALDNCLLTFPDAKFELFVDGELDSVSEDSLNMAIYAVDFANVERLTIGQNSGTFLHVLDFACKLDADETVYFVEDDYVHRQGSEEVLLDGLEHFDYVTLYDHPDKYLWNSHGPSGDNGTVCRTARSHWKNVISTTMTFAAKVRTLREDRQAIEFHCEGAVPQDHRMFIALGIDRGRRLVSPIPGYSTHAEARFLAPGVDWEGVFAG